MTSSENMFILRPTNCKITGAAEDKLEVVEFRSKRWFEFFSFLLIRCLSIKTAFTGEICFILGI